MFANETILVTGASGFIGGWLVESLYLSGCKNVIAGIRAWPSAARIARFPIDITLCDVLNPEQVQKAVEKSTLIIHCAMGNKDVIINGTYNVLSAAAKSGVKHVVHLSTAEVYGNVKGVVDETCPLSYSNNEYADSKVEAEKLCQTFFQKGLPVTVLRPSIVYGPFAEWWVARFAKCLSSGNWGVFNDYADGMCNLVYVGDLVSASLLALSNEKAAGEAFNINGPDKISWNEYFQFLNSGLGYPKLKEIKPWEIKAKSMIIDPIRATGNFAVEKYNAQIMQLNERVIPIRKVLQSVKNIVRTTPSLQELSLYNRGAYYSDKKAKEILGYNPKIDINQGVKFSVEWLELLGFLSQM